MVSRWRDTEAQRRKERGLEQDCGCGCQHQAMACTTGAASQVGGTAGGCLASSWQTHSGYWVLLPHRIISGISGSSGQSQASQTGAGSGSLGPRSACPPLSPLACDFGAVWASSRRMLGLQWHAEHSGRGPGGETDCRAHVLVGTLPALDRLGQSRSVALHLASSNARTAHRASRGAVGTA